MARQRHRREYLEVPVDAGVGIMTSAGARCRISDSNGSPKNRRLKISRRKRSGSEQPLTEAFHGADAAVPMYQQILAQNQNHAAANFAIGRILLSRDDFNGVPMIEQAMDLNSDFVPIGCGLIQAFLVHHGREDDAEGFHRKATEYQRIVALAALERRRIYRHDRFIETGLDAATIAPIRNELSKCPEIARAYLVQKVVTHFPEKFFYALGVVPRLGEAFRFHRRASLGLAQRLASRMPLPCLVVVLRARSWRITRCMKRVNRALIYSRPR